jgi:hypothetical protein
MSGSNPVKGGENLLKAKTITYVTWVTVVTAVIATLSFLMLALSMHHSTRSAGGTGFGFHDGDI